MESSCLAPGSCSGDGVLYFGRCVFTVELGRWVAPQATSAGPRRAGVCTHDNTSSRYKQAAWRIPGPGAALKAGLKHCVLSWNACPRPLQPELNISPVCADHGAPRPHRPGPELREALTPLIKINVCLCQASRSPGCMGDERSGLISSACIPAGRGLVLPLRRPPAQGHPAGNTVEGEGRGGAFRWAPPGSHLSQGVCFLGSSEFCAQCKVLCVCVCVWFSTAL